MAVMTGVAALALGACGPIPVKTDYNAGIGVSSCHTYSWLQEHINNAGQPAAYGNPLNADRLRVAIESNLAAKGIQRVEDHSTADCMVGYAIGSRQVADDYGGVSLGMGYGWGGGWRHRGFGGAWGGYDWPLMRNEGRIAVDLFDAKSRRAIWHASVDQDVVDLTGPSAEAKINAAAAALFTKFPGSGAAQPAARTTT
jgi:hypothetical protein